MVSLRGFLYLESKPNYCFDGLRAALGRRADLFCRLSYRLRVRHELHYRSEISDKPQCNASPTGFATHR